MSIEETSKKFKKFIPAFLIDRINPETSSIRKFVKFAANEIAENSVIIDAGAGEAPYKDYFSKAKYYATDFAMADPSLDYSHLNFISDIYLLPIKNSCVDAILFTQVLEHVKYPFQVVKELFRILKPRGKLFLTAPQGWGIHQPPYDYFRFTYYGLKFLFEDAGFKINFIMPRGGFYSYLGHRIMISYKIYEQHFTNPLLKFILLPIQGVHLLLSAIAAIICSFLDAMDRDKNWTLGYSCLCQKP